MDLKKIDAFKNTDEAKKLIKQIEFKLKYLEEIYGMSATKMQVYQELEKQLKNPSLNNNNKI